MYPVYHTAAQFQQEQEAVTATHYALEAEKIHAEIYAQAKKQVDAGTDIALDTVYICPVCGYTVEGEAPDYCPVCGAARKRFVAFEA